MKAGLSSLPFRGGNGNDLVVKVNGVRSSLDCSVSGDPLSGVWFSGPVR